MNIIGAVYCAIIFIGYEYNWSSLLCNYIHRVMNIIGAVYQIIFIGYEYNYTSTFQFPDGNTTSQCPNKVE